MRPAAVAPMEGVTGFPMRLWLHLAAQPAAMTTPFLRVTRGQPERRVPLLFAPELFELRGALPYELTPQLLSGDADNFLRAAAMLDAAPAAAIEINCGCPCPTCIGKHAGSGILAEPDVFATTVARLAAELGPRRLAVKMRLGFAAPGEFAGLLPHVAALPLARLTVHGRTRAQGYGGAACWDKVADATAASPTPTWGSGDVIDLRTYDAARTRAPRVAGILIGRGLLRNPWVFAELRTGVPTPPPLAALPNALLAFALLNHLAITAPELLLAKVGNGRLGAPCGTSPEAWERLAATLSTWAFGVPRVITRTSGDLDLPVSPTVYPRLKYLWGFLRTNLPDPFDSPAPLRAKTASNFFNSLKLLS